MKSMIDKYNFYRKVFKKLDPQIDKQLDIFISSDTFNTEFVKDNEIVTLLNSNSKDISSNGVKKIVGSDNYYEQNGTLDKKNPGRFTLSEQSWGLPRCI